MTADALDLERRLRMKSSAYERLMVHVYSKDIPIISLLKRDPCATERCTLEENCSASTTSKQEQEHHTNEKAPGIRNTTPCRSREH